MRRFGTKNLNEARYDSSEFDFSIDDYSFNQTSNWRGYVSAEDISGDLDRAESKDDGPAFVRIATEFLDYLVDPDTQKLAKKHSWYQEAISNTNVNLIKQAIEKLKKNPSDTAAREIIKDEVSDFWEWLD